jgi:hypothetical protein
LYSLECVGVDAAIAMQPNARSDPIVERAVEVGG